MLHNYFATAPKRGAHFSLSDIKILVLSYTQVKKVFLHKIYTDVRVTLDMEQECNREGMEPCIQFVWLVKPVLHSQLEGLFGLEQA